MCGTTTLKVGAGSGEIIFPDAMFPMPEGFSKIHDNPHARVLIAENGTKVAFVSMELINTSADANDIIRQIINEKTGTPIDNIWVQSTHVFCTPHAPDDAEQRAMFIHAVTKAVTEAVIQAVASFQDAVYGIGCGECDLTTSRDVRTADGWIWGLNGEGEVDRTMTVLKFDSLSGKPIGMIFTYGTRSACADVTRGTGNREITSDLTGVAAVALEREYGVPALFLATADADQTPIETALRIEANEDGTVTETDLGVQEGLKIAQRLGTRMGNDAIDIAKTISCTDAKAEIACAGTSFEWATLSDDSVMEIGILSIVIGDTAFVGIKPEVNCITSLQLKAESPYTNTLLMSFVNGDQKYMPDAANYDLGKPESKNTRLAKGAAEKFVETAALLLRNMRNGVVCPLGSAAGADATGGMAPAVEMVKLGGYDWRVLDIQNNKAMLLCEKALLTMAYREDGTAATWETSDVRAYLNGILFNCVFSDEEKARIVETINVNKANAQYGTPGGKDTADKVFLLSCKEAEQYFTSAEDRIATDIAGNVVMWLLRTPGRDGEYICNVNASGYVDYHGILVVDASNNDANAGSGIRDYASGVNGGIRPALWMRID